VNCKPLAEEAIKVGFLFSMLYQGAEEAHSSQRTKAGELHIAPKQSESDWFRWLENIQDWCISRQLWWGHRCPAYFVRIEGQEQDVRLSAYFFTLL
jgi:valyl-tRNA synthetase